jgi:hypothetical protein
VQREELSNLWIGGFQATSDPVVSSPGCIGSGVMSVGRSSRIGQTTDGHAFSDARSELASVAELQLSVGVHDLKRT